MFAFGLTTVGMLWLYSVRHAAPFLPLQRALAQEFENSAPKVEGGQRKIHKQTPKVLRIVMKVGFDPTDEPERAKSFANRVTMFVHKHHDLSEYELLEIHLFWPEPEKEIKQWTIEQKVAELIDPPPDE
jgi:hypothetical protein